MNKDPVQKSKIQGPEPKPQEKINISSKTKTGENKSQSTLKPTPPELNKANPSGQTKPKAKSNEVNSSKKTEESSKTVFGIIGLSIVLILFLIAIGAYYITSKNDEDDGTITIEDVDPESIEELSSQIQYNDGDGVGEYYSPELDGIFEYNESTIRIYEGVGSLSLVPATSAFGDVVSAQLGLKTDSPEDLIAIKKEYLEGVYSAVESELPEYVEVLDGTSTIYYEYERKQLGSDELQKVFNILFVRSIDDKTLYLDFNAYGTEENIKNYISDYTAIFNSFSTDLSTLEQKIGYKIQDSLTVDFDRDQWKISYSSDTQVSLMYRSNDYEEKKEDGTYDSTSLTISSIASQVIKTNEDFASQLEYEFNSTKSTYLNSELIEEATTIDIDGTSFTTIEYKYDNSTGRTTFIKRYEGYDEMNKQLISMTVLSSNNESKGYIDGVAVAEGIDIEQPEDQASLVRDIIASVKESGSVLGTSTSTVDIKKAAVIGEPAVVRIYHRTCVDIAFGQISGFKNISNNKYTECEGSFGTGFYINEEGNIITNAHVATPNATDTLISSMMAEEWDSPLFADLATDVATIIISEYPELARYPDEAKDYIILGMVSTIIESDKESNTISTARHDNYLQNNAPFTINMVDYSLTNASEHIKAEVVDYNELGSSFEFFIEDGNENKQYTYEVADLALLKSTASDISEVSLPVIDLLTEKQIVLGNQVHVIGFPGSANNKSIFSATSDDIPTITQGNVSAIKPSASDEYNLVQVDASISHGNSGGPILDSDGKLIAVATYSITGGDGSGDFNAGISVDEVKKLLDENNVKASQSKVSASIESGLDNLSKSYYAWAVEDFNEAIGYNSNLASNLDPLIDIANEKIAAGEDKTPLFALGPINIGTGELAIIAAVVIVIVVLLTTVVALFAKAKKRKSAARMNQNANNAPIHQAPVQMPPQQQMQQDQAAQAQAQAIAAQEQANAQAQAYAQAAQEQAQAQAYAQAAAAQQQAEAQAHAQAVAQAVAAQEQANAQAYAQAQQAAIVAQQEADAQFTNTAQQAQAPVAQPIMPQAPTYPVEPTQVDQFQQPIQSQDPVQG